MSESIKKIVDVRAGLSGNDKISVEFDVTPDANIYDVMRCLMGILATIGSRIEKVKERHPEYAEMMDKMVTASAMKLEGEKLIPHSQRQM